LSLESSGTDAPLNLKRLEENEINYWKWWSDFFEKGPVKFYFNPYLKDDILPTHAFSEDWTDPKRVLQKIEDFYRGKKAQAAAVFMPYGPLDGNTLQQLLDNGFNVYDSMKIMQLFTDLPTETKQNVKAKVIGEKDLTVWHRVYCTSFEEPPASQAELKRRFQKMIANSDFVFYLAEIEEIPAATLMTYVHKDVAGLYCIGTLSEFRKKGLATILMERSANDAKDIGCDLIFLQTLAQENLEGFYNKRGFTTVAIRSLWSKPL
jgi:N-acetylglutamate synthase-like GNAT family acetyltransferase